MKIIEQGQGFGLGYISAILFIIGITAFVAAALGFVVSLGLWVYSDAKERADNAEMWLLIVLLTNIVGLIIYLAAGRDKTREGTGKYKKLVIGFAVALIPAILLYIIGLAVFMMNKISYSVDFGTEIVEEIDWYYGE